MARCLIFCAAAFDGLLTPAAPDDYIIAADGGYAHVQSLGLEPDCILGDFDSLGFVPDSAKVFPVEKDDTDAMLAVRKGLSLGYAEFLIYGGLDGSRLDHTLANYQTLQFLADHNATGYLVGLDYIATVIQGETLRFPAGSDGILSLFCLGPDASGITLTGLKYPLTDGALTSGFPLGVSNHFTGDAATVTVKDGSLLALWDRNVGFPGRQPLPKEVLS